MATCEWNEAACSQEGTHTVVVRLPGQPEQSWLVCTDHDKDVKRRAVLSRPKAQNPEVDNGSTVLLCQECGFPRENQDESCPVCGSSRKDYKVGFQETLTTHGSLAVKVKHQGKGKPVLETKSGDSFTRVLNAWGKRELLTDRENNRYWEKIVLHDGTEIESNATLKAHQGH